jgi:uncharacterized protein YbjT (DUF2867 family)
VKRVLVVGAGGQIAREVLKLVGADVQLTLFLRNVSKLVVRPSSAKVVQGDVLDAEKLDEAMRGQSLVYANLDGAVDEHAKGLIAAMKTAHVERLVFVNTMGIYDEVPGAFGTWNREQIGDSIPPFRRAADLIEASGLDSTVLRPAWLFDADEVDYEVTQRNEPFKGTEVSRKSVASLIVDIIEDPKRWSRTNLGVNKPGTNGDKPSFK